VGKDNKIHKTKGTEVSDLFNSGIRPLIDKYLTKKSEEVRLYPNFPGTLQEYKKLHKWVRKNFTKPGSCEHCGTQVAKRYDWATIENRYTKERDDWEYLCRSCHVKSDGRINQLKKGLEGALPWNLGKKMSPAARAKMRANHWSTKRSWIPRERDEHGRFI
jgi:hypothetical protein